jgi:ribosomal protein L40E
MLSKTVLLLGASAALLLGGMNLACSSSSTAGAGKEPAASSVAASASTTQPVAETPTSTDDPFHITKPTAPLDGAPAPQTTPSPEAIVANKKVCPNCGTPNAANATACVKCGHEFK